MSTPTGILDSHGHNYLDSTKVTKDIQKCWRNCEQPFFVLTFALHPRYRKTALHILELSEIQVSTWRNVSNVLTARRLADAALLYYVLQA
jgi:hypothetical protein